MAYKMTQRLRTRFNRAAKAIRGQLPADLPKARREAALMRYCVLDAWREVKIASGPLGYRSDQLTAHFLGVLAAAGIRLSRTTLYSWDRNYQERGVAGLLDARGLKQLPELEQGGVEGGS